MVFAGINTWAILVAAVAAWFAGAAWYGALGNRWLAALGRAKGDFRQTPVPFVLSFLAELLMAFMLAGLIGHLGAVSVWTGVVSGFFVWFGFVIPTLSVNYAYAQRAPMLTLIDGGHWLAVLLIMGAVIGAFGV